MIPQAPQNTRIRAQPRQFADRFVNFAFPVMFDEDFALETEGGGASLLLEWSLKEKVSRGPARRARPTPGQTPRAIDVAYDRQIANVRRPFGDEMVLA